MIFYFYNENYKKIINISFNCLKKVFFFPKPIKGFFLIKKKKKNKFFKKKKLKK
jgi:hypothetical protein